MTYAEKLKDPRWQKKRLEIFEQANWECQSCGESSKSLQVHHKRYIARQNPWDYEDWDLECLCVDCHERITRLNNDIKDVLSDVDESFKEQLRGYLEAHRIFEKYHNSGMNPITNITYDHSGEFWEGFADFFGLTVNTIISLYDPTIRGIFYSVLDTAWFAKIRIRRS